MPQNRIVSLNEKIMRYESGEMSENEELELFSELVKNGMAWTLQGHYGRMANQLIQNGYLDNRGKILKQF